MVVVDATQDTAEYKTKLNLIRVAAMLIDDREEKKTAGNFQDSRGPSVEGVIY